VQTLLQDLRFALRQIVRNPGFSITSILSLTLGIGATVAVYSILYDAVLHPWPYAGFERVCDVWLTDNSGHDDTWGLTGPQIRQLRQTQAVEDVVASTYTEETVTGSDVPDEVIVDALTGLPPPTRPMQKIRCPSLCWATSSGNVIIVATLPLWARQSNSTIRAIRSSG
jgi:hypothetical protein